MRALSAVLFAFLLAAGPAVALPVEKITVDTARGHTAFKVEIASDHASQEKGLMFRKKMAANAGMLFDFHTTVMTSFWMKNTILPLDIIFIRTDGTVSSIAANAVPMSETPIPASEPVQAVLELNAGRAAQIGLAPGDKVHSAIFKTGR
ncbi:MAG TPA: DUF192 domain-containing protein [Rhizomicrobium sp.]|nr:DUF192 domain-containing protein [Rhizomicrobium sp.]